MISLVLESPWIVFFIGIAFSLVCVQAALQLGKKELFWIAGSLAILAGVLCYVGHVVVTEREAIIAMLTKTAVAIETNDPSTVLAAVFPTPATAVLNAKAILPSVKVKSFTITKIFDIRFSGPESVRRSKVALNVHLAAEFRGLAIDIPQYLEITLYRVKDEWLVYDFINTSPMQGFKEQLILDGDW